MSLMRIPIAIFIIIQLCGCGPFSQESGLVKDYKLFSLESLYDTNLVKGTVGGVEKEVIPCYVFAVGWNDDFIIAKRNPQHLKQKKIEWYIVETANNMVHGPYNEQEFRVKRNELGVPVDLSFTINTENHGGELI